MKIDASDLYDDALRRLTRHWIRKVQTLAPDARRGEVDAVHDMRTGIRRIRTLLGMMKGKRSKRLRRSIQTLGLRLGAIRDLDVGLAHIEESVRREELVRDKAVARLEVAMAAERQENLHRLRRALRKTSTRRWFRKAKRWTRKKSDGRLVHEALPAALDRLSEQVISLADASNLSQKHELRKAFKRLRYAIEMFGSALPASLREVAGQAHAAQDALGDERDRAALADRAEGEAVACAVMGEDEEELIAYARRLREVPFPNELVAHAVARATTLRARSAPVSS